MKTGNYINIPIASLRSNRTLSLSRNDFFLPLKPIHFKTNCQSRISLFCLHIPNISKRKSKTRKSPSTDRNHTEFAIFSSNPFDWCYNFRKSRVYTVTSKHSIHWLKVRMSSFHTQKKRIQCRFIVSAIPTHVEDRYTTYERL